MWGLLRTLYENHAHSTSGYPPPFLFNEPLESDWIRHWKLNLKIQASQGSQKRPILPNKILFWLNTPQWLVNNTNCRFPSEKYTTDENLSLVENTRNSKVISVNYNPQFYQWENTQCTEGWECDLGFWGLKIFFCQ